MAPILPTHHLTVRPTHCSSCGLRRYLGDDPALASVACDGDSYFSSSPGTPDCTPMLAYQDAYFDAPAPKIALWARVWGALKDLLHLRGPRGWARSCG